MQHTDVGSSATSTVVAFAHHKYESPSKTILTGKQGEIRQNDELTWLLQGFQTPKSPGLCALGNESFGYFPSDSLVKHPELSSSQAPGSLSPGRGEAFGPKKADLTLRLGYLQARHRAVKARAATAGFFFTAGFFPKPQNVISGKIILQTHFCLVPCRVSIHLMEYPATCCIAHSHIACAWWFRFFTLSPMEMG